MKNFNLTHIDVNNIIETYELRTNLKVIDKIDELCCGKNIHNEKIYLFIKNDFVLITKSYLLIQQLFQTIDSLMKIPEEIYLMEYYTFKQAYTGALQYSNEELNKIIK